MSSNTVPIANTQIGPQDSDIGFDRYRLIDKKTLLAVVPRSYSSIWDMMRRGEFPLSVRIGDRVYWRWNEVEKWLDELPRSEYREANAPDKPHSRTGR